MFFIKGDVQARATVKDPSAPGNYVAKSNIINLSDFPVSGF